MNQNNARIQRAILKITQEMFNELVNGKKKREYRKLNKDYIQPGHRVSFLDLETEQMLGSSVVDTKCYVKPNMAVATCKHQGTRDFLNNNYAEEPMLIELQFHEIKVVERND